MALRDNERTQLFPETHNQVVTAIREGVVADAWAQVGRACVCQSLSASFCQSLTCMLIKYLLSFHSFPASFKLRAVEMLHCNACWPHRIIIAHA
jgi:hypothetical protein